LVAESKLRTANLMNLMTELSSLLLENNSSELNSKNQTGEVKIVTNNRDLEQVHQKQGKREIRLLHIRKLKSDSRHFY